MFRITKCLILIILIFLTINFKYGSIFALEIQEHPDTKKIDKYVNNIMKEYRIPGFSLGIIYKNNVVYKKGYGISDNTQRKVTPQTPFITGSLSKTFTAIAIMQLVESGKISLDEPVSAYIPWFQLANKEISSKTTVRDLITHTSGISTDAEFSVATTRGDDTSITQIVKKFDSLKQNTMPGTRYQYSNANFIILGEIIQRLTGISYEEYLKHNIFEPLEKEHSYV